MEDVITQKWVQEQWEIIRKTPAFKELLSDIKKRNRMNIKNRKYPIGALHNSIGLP